MDKLLKLLTASQVEKLYFEFVTKFDNVESFASCYQLTVDGARSLIDCGKTITDARNKLNKEGDS